MTFPIEIKRQGTVFARIYRQERAKGDGEKFYVYQVADYSSGVRVLRSYTDFDKAKTEANTIADNRSKTGGEASITLRGQDLTVYVTALDLLRPSGIPLNVAAARVAESVKILGYDRIIEAAQFLDKKHPARLPQKTVREIVDELIATKQALKESRLKSGGMKDPDKLKAELKRDRYLCDLRYRLGSFADDFQRNLSAVAGSEMQDWLHGLKLGPQSYLNFRTVIGTLFKFAKRRGYLARDNDEAERIEKVDGNGGEITIYSPAELQRLIKAAPRSFLPCLVIGAFAGLRSSEIERLEWKDVDLKRKFIKVLGARKRGTPSRRVVPIADCLAVWLDDHARASGKVWTGTHDEFYDAQQATAMATKYPHHTIKPVSEKPPIIDSGAKLEGEVLEWKHNALRHSFISYRLAEVQNVNQVALEAGNSATTIDAHYKELVTPEQAREWFGVRP